MVNDFPYVETTKRFQEALALWNANSKSVLISSTIANNWLYDFDDSLLSETERLNVILPLIKLCVERGDLPKEIEGELRYYHGEYIDGNLDQFLDPKEADAVIRDLEWSFHAAFPNEK